MRDYILDHKVLICEVKAKILDIIAELKDEDAAERLLRVVDRLDEGEPRGKELRI